MSKDCWSINSVMCSLWILGASHTFTCCILFVCMAVKEVHRLSLASHLPSIGKTVTFVVGISKGIWNFLLALAMSNGASTVSFCTVAWVLLSSKVLHSLLQSFPDASTASLVVLKSLRIGVCFKSFDLPCIWFFDGFLIKNTLYLQLVISYLVCIAAFPTIPMRLLELDCRKDIFGSTI